MVVASKGLAGLGCGSGRGLVDIREHDNTGASLGKGVGNALTNAMGCLRGRKTSFISNFVVDADNEICSLLSQMQYLRCETKPFYGRTCEITTR